MGYVNSRPEDEYRSTVTSQANGTTQIIPDGWSSGLLTAIPRGLTDAALKTNAALNDLLDPVDRYFGLEGFNKAVSVDIPEQLKEWARPDARFHGKPAQVIQGVTGGLGLAATGAALGGPIGAAAMLGGVEGHATYKEQREGGVDESTAMKVAGITGLANALGVFLPMSVTKSAVQGIAARAFGAEVAGNTTLAGALYSTAETLAPVAGKLPTAAAVGASGNVLTGMAQRAAVGAVLSENGYKEMADQYRVFDAQSMAAEVILGAAFGGLAHYADPSRVRPSDIDAAMAIKKQEQFDRSGLGVHTTPLAANTHDAVMRDSIESLMLGKDVNVSPQDAEILTRDVVADPTAEPLAQMHRDAVAETFGAHDLMGSPVEITPVKPIEPVRAIQEPTAPPTAAPAETDIHPLAREMLNQITANHPELEIQLADGRVVKMADLPTVLSENMAAAQKDSVLHDIAAACYIQRAL